MIRAIDTGNTHTVLGCINSDGTIAPVLRMETNPRQTEFEYAASMSRILELSGIKMSGIKGAIISSVVPTVTNTLKEAVRLMTGGVEALVVGVGIRTGLDIGLDDPASIAADLVATAVAAKEDYPLPAIIIDMGTATTVTVVNADGRYIGGAIYPGVGISLNALVSGTSLLPNIEIAPPKKAIGTNTIEAMKSGLFYSEVGALDLLIDRFKEEMGVADCTIVATGGIAGKVAQYSRHNIILNDVLLLRGLEILYKRNTQEPRKRTKKRG